MLNNLRYFLPPRGKKVTCPACGQPKRFKLYHDATTGHPAGDEYGRCDRQDHCGYDLRPQAGPQPKFDTTSFWNSPTALPKPLAILPEEIVTASLTHYRANNLAKMLGRVIGYGQADELLLGMEVGTSSHWPGATVFFQRDAYGRPRSGQVVHFDLQSGKTLKDTNTAGKQHRRTTWLHKTIRKALQRKGEPLPQWLKDYEEAEQVCGWLFGLRYVLKSAKTLPVGIVEAPKTALLCNAFLPTHAWAATCGLSNLTETRLRPLLDRRIELFPDASENGSALASWRKKAEQLRSLGFRVTVNETLESLATPEQRQAGYDLADVILDNYSGYPPSWDAPTI